MPAEELVVHGAREHNLKDVTVTLPRNKLVCITGLSGSGQVEPRVRHDLRRGAAPLRRVAERLRAPVPPDDGEARRRLDRRALAGDLDRPEDDVAQPALDGRHRHRDLRLPAPALRARRPPALPDLRPADRGAVDRADRRPGARAARGDALHRQRAGRARPQGRVPRDLRGAPQPGLHAREGRRRAAPARGDDRARQEVQAHDRGGRRPARDEAGPAHAPVAVDRDRGRARRGARRHRPPRGGPRAALQREVRLPRARRLAARAAAAHLLVQLAARRLPALHRARLAAGDRPRPRRPGPDALDRRGRARAVVGRQRRASTRRSSRASPTATRSTSTRPGRTCPTSSRTGSCTAPTATASTSSTATAWAASARTCSPSRASSRT